MVWNRCGGRFSLIPFALDSGHDRTERTLWLALLRVPVQTVFLSRIAYELLRVLQKSVSVAVFDRILPLSIDDRQTSLNRKQLILADPPIENFFLAFVGVENPSLAFLHNRDWERPLLFANEQNRGFPFGRQPVLFVIGLNKLAAPLFVSNRVAGK